MAGNPEKKVLKLTAKAVILNDVEGIVAQNLSCVAGFPNITFSNVKDPLSNVEKITDFINSLNSVSNAREQPRSRGVTATMAAQQVMVNSAYGGPSMDSENSNTNEPTSNNDLHFYNFHNVTLPKDERVYLPIFNMETKYCDVYHVSSLPC